MTASALFMLIATWGVVGFFTIYFLIKAIRSNELKD